MNNETEIIAYSFAEQIAPADINATEHKVNITVAEGTSLNGLVATYTLSEGATATVSGIEQESGVTPNNFTNTLAFKVTAENGVDNQLWQIIVDVEDSNLSDQANILNYAFAEQLIPATINSATREIEVLVAMDTDVSELVATFTLSENATAKIDEVEQESGTTANDFTNPVVYTVTAENGYTVLDWTVTVTVSDQLNDQADILTYYIPQQTSEPEFVEAEYPEIHVTVAYGTDITNLVPEFTLSPGANATVNNIPQTSGTSIVNFTNSVVYSVTSEDQQLTRYWIVTVTIDPNTDIKDIENSALAIYPNPNNGNFTLDFANINGKVNYQIFDTKGSIILNENFVANGNAIKEVSLNLVPGVYFVKLVTENQSLIEKLVIE